MRRHFWTRFATKLGFLLIAKAAQRLLSMHVISCSSECNWSQGGTVFTASRNRLGKERGKMMIDIHDNFKSRARDSFAVTLSVSEEEEQEL